MQRNIKIQRNGLTLFFCFFFWVYYLRFVLGISTSWG